MTVTTNYLVTGNGITGSTANTVQALVSGAGNIGTVTNPAALDLWRRRRAKASAPLARPALVQVVGDSIEFGVTSSGAANDSTTALSSWVERTAAIVNSRLGISVPPVVYNAHDSRLTLAGGAAASTSVGLIGRSVAIQAAGHQITTPSFSFTSLEAWYFESDGTGSPADPNTGVFSVNIDAAGATSMTDGAAFRTYKEYAPSDVSAGAHTAVLARVSGANYITGVMGYTKTANGSGVAFNRCALSGAALVDAIAGGGVTTALTGAGPARVLAAWGNQGDPDLIIIAFAHNDATYYTPAQYSTYLDTVLAQIGTTIPVMLLSPPYPPTSQATGTYGTRTDYRDVMAAKAVAGSNVCHVRMSSILGTRAQADADSLYYDATTVHPSDRGYAAIAQSMAALLLA